MIWKRKKHPLRKALHFVSDKNISVHDEIEKLKSGCSDDRKKDVEEGVEEDNGSCDDN